MRRTASVVLACAMVVLGGPPAVADVGISIVSVSAGFSPAITVGPIGTTFTWTNDDAIDHTSTQSSSLSLWNSGRLDPGEDFSKKVNFAGTYPYHCAIHSTMTGKVRVPVDASPATGSVDSVFTITIAAVSAPSGFVYDVQRKKGSGDWTAFRTGITSRAVRFDPTSTGRYAFRTRLRATSNGARSGWSPSDKVTVS